MNDEDVPDGNGVMKYDDGPAVKGRWKEGEMVLEEEDDRGARPQAAARDDGAADDAELLKQQQLRQFHERNQQFLQAQAQQQQHQLAIEQQHQQHQLMIEQEAEMQKLNEQVYLLQEHVRQLSHELRITQDAHQLNKDQSRAEIEMLHTELERQNSRHEQIVSSLRNRLVESEMARMKMQDQLSSRMEEDAQRDEELRGRWKEMTTRVLEDKKWVDEQMDYWKESMEEHRKRLSGAKVRGRLDAALGGGEEGGGASAAKGRSPPGSPRSDAALRRSQQRRLWGASDPGDESDSESSSEEGHRIFGNNSRG